MFIEKMSNGEENENNKVGESDPIHLKIVQSVICMKKKRSNCSFIVVIPTSLRLIQLGVLAKSADKELYDKLIQLNLPKPENLISNIEFARYITVRNDLEDIVLLYPGGNFLDSLDDFLASVYAVKKSLSERSLNFKLIMPIISQQQFDLLNEKYSDIELLPHRIERDCSPKLTLFDSYRNQNMSHFDTSSDDEKRFNEENLVERSYSDSDDDEFRLFKDSGGYPSDGICRVS